MNNEEKQTNADSCCMFCKNGKMMCGGQNGMHMHHGCRIFRWILGIIILWAVFMGGVKLGELKGLINDDGFRGSRNMMYGSRMMNSGGGYGMKNFQSGDCPFLNKAPSNSGIEETVLPSPGKTAPKGEFLQ